METRINPYKLSPKGYQAMMGLEKFIHDCGLDAKLVHMLKLRASQINGCAYCIDMHWKDAIAAGETDQRLYGLDAWEEAPYYNDRERAALKWTESLTNISETHAPDADYEALRAQFSDEEVVNLTLVVSTINAWNRLAIGFRSPAGSYQPPKHG